MAIYLFSMLIIALLAALLLYKSHLVGRHEMLKMLLFCLMLLIVMIIGLIFVNAFRISLG